MQKHKSMCRSPETGPRHSRREFITSVGSGAALLATPTSSDTLGAEKSVVGYETFRYGQLHRWEILPTVQCLTKTGWSLGPSGRFPGRSARVEQITDRVKIGADQVEVAFRTLDLRVDVEYVTIPEHRAVRVSGTIRNDQPQPIRCYHVRPLAMMLQVDAAARIELMSIKGGIESAYFPPESFRAHRDELSQQTTIRTYDSGYGGYSTNNDIPLLAVQLCEQGGLFWALEWPGPWWGCVNRMRDPSRLWLEVGPVAALRAYRQVEQIDIELEPGESIPLPPCVVGLYEGDLQEGCNAVRRLVGSQTPSLNGNRMVPPVSFNSWFDLHLSTSDTSLRPHVDAAADIGVEYFVQDAGWYDQSLMKGWEFMHGTGNWRTPNPNKFPQGLKTVANYINSKGMKFGLWWAPENCDRRGRFAQEHPDWVRPLELGEPSMVGAHCLVDLGKPEVIAYLKESLDLMVSEFGLEWLRWDLNMYPEPIWDRADPPHRRGITQIRHIEGLLELWDYLLQEHPHVCVEACCGGGRRMDLACLKRAHTYWCNDESRRPETQRHENTGANFFLPPNYLNRNVLYERSDGFPDSCYHALMGGCLGFGDGLADWSQRAKDQASRHVAVFKQIRRRLLADYRPLFDRQPHSRDEWDGWQFHDSETGQGAVFVFRCQAGQSYRIAKLRWIDPDATYQFVNPYDQASTVVKGRELSENGLRIELENKGDSQLVIYEKRV